MTDQPIRLRSWRLHGKPRRRADNSYALPGLPDCLEPSGEVEPWDDRYITLPPVGRPRAQVNAISIGIMRDRIAELIDGPYTLEQLAVSVTSNGRPPNVAAFNRAACRRELARVIRARDARAAHQPSRTLLAAALGCSTEALRKLCDKPAHKVEGESMMIATDEQLAEDARRLALIAEETLRMAARLQARFPTSSVLADVVERFVALTLDEADRAA